MQDAPDLSAPPPFTLSDLRAAIPDECWEKDGLRSTAYLIKDVAIVLGLAAVALSIDSWCDSPAHVYSMTACMSCMCTFLVRLSIVQCFHRRGFQVRVFVGHAHVRDVCVVRMAAQAVLVALPDTASATLQSVLS